MAYLPMLKAFIHYTYTRDHPLEKLGSQNPICSWEIRIREIEGNAISSICAL